MSQDEAKRTEGCLRGIFLKYVVHLLILIVAVQGLPFWKLSQGHQRLQGRSALERVLDRLGCSTAEAGEVSVFGPKKYIRTKGKPNIYTDRFSAQAGKGTVVVVNGKADGSHRVSSAIITLNGRNILKTKDFNQNVYRLRAVVDLAALNTLVVQLRSKPDSFLTIEILAEKQNNPPVADAGPDQTVFAGDKVTLDGSASSDMDGDTLTYTWSLTLVPPGSTATLSDPAAVKPTFVVDKPGIYAVQLIVNDGYEDSAPDTVTVTTQNSTPVANAGPDQTVFIINTVTLDGSKSSDVDGDLLTHYWSFTAIPPGSAATLSDPAAVKPTFVVDKPGIYAVQLIVNDGYEDSAPDTVTLTTQNSAPVANAGPDQSVFVGYTAILDGSKSTDMDGDLLTFAWAFTSKPFESVAVPSDPSAVKPTFDVDKPGTYVAQLIVNDGTVGSAPDTVSITTQNSPPVANAGPDQSAFVGQLVVLEGSSCSDADGDALTYWWSFTSIPATSAVALSDQTAVNPTFTPDAAGLYVVQLIVNDGTVDGAPDTASLSVIVAECQPGVTRPCYEGPRGMLGIGQCKEGIQTCGPEFVFGSCEGQVLPSVEIPNNGIDEDCNGLDAQCVPGETQPCYTGPAGTQGIGICRAGTATCEDNGIYGQCIGQILPSTEIPDNGIDEDCNGSDSVTVVLPPDPSTVAPPIDPTVSTDTFTATQFLYSGANPVQTGMQPDTIDQRRAAVIRGQALDKQDAPLSGVAITVLNHPEFGQTLSRTDGRFDLVVNGGGELTLDYRKNGYLPVQRQVRVPWQEYAQVDDAILIAEDANLNTIDLTDTTQSFQVAQGSIITDQDGTRQATLLIPQGTQAQVYNANGTTRTVTNLNLRLTEYTVGSNGPKAMPAPLPPTSAYTYAFEMKAEEANIKINGKDVLFDRPVPFYITNFLNFPVGTSVPVGYYDSDKAAWVPSNNGKVIKILALNGGSADLDTDGDGLADDATTLAALGITDEERIRLAGLYAAGATLWRVQVSHLSTWDCNWPYRMPDDAAAPNVPRPTGGPGDVDDPTLSCGSIIECENQVLRESLPITGTGLTLNYSSRRVPGRTAGRTLTILLSGSQVPASLKRIDVVIEVAGLRFARSFPPTTNQSYTFTWDGRDAFGRHVAGIRPAMVRIGYVYDPVYATPAQQAAAFALFSGVPLEGSRARNEVILWQYHETSLSGAYPSADSDRLGSWTLGNHHFYDPIGTVLILGDGSYRRVQAEGFVIGTAAGGGSGDDGGPATAAALRQPFGVAVGSDGSLFIAEYGDSRIRRVGSDGVITTVAGTGVQGYGGDGGPATAAMLENPTGVAVGGDGSLSIADYQNHTIRRVGADGVITTVAGTGIQGYGGDGGPATAAMLHRPIGVAVGSDGSLYIADQNNHRIRRVGADGVITTVAGGGTGGDGGPATAAILSLPAGVAVGDDGSLYIAELGRHRIRRVGPDGVITTVAGTSMGYSGDGGPATAAKLSYPTGVAVGGDGSLYISEIGYRIRMVGPDGVITTVAGNGVAGSGGDGGPATAAQLTSPRGVAMGPEGIYLATQSDHRIRRLSQRVQGLIALGGHFIPSEDGTEIFVFSLSNRHLRTLDALTGVVIYQFGYDGAGRLTSVTDRDGDITVIERDALGAPIAIVGPYGQRTTLTTDANGFLQSVTNPAGEAHQMTYTAGGLLTRFTDPGGHGSQINYDALGRLERDTDAAGGFTQLTRTGTDQTYAVTLDTALGRTTRHQVNRLPAGGQLRTTITPDGTQTQLTIGTDGSRTITFPDGTVNALVEGPDPRFSMQAPITKSLTVTTGGLTASLAATRTVTLVNPDDVLSLNQITDTVTINGRTSTSVYDGPSRTASFTSAAGRTAAATLDTLGRPTQFAITGIAPVNAVYDAHGLLSTVSAGSGAETRTASFGYNAQGYPETLTDPLGRTTRYAYDAAGRPTSLTLPDLRQILFAYDGVGNLTSLTPPGRPAHVFSYNPVNSPATYEPPLLPANGGSTLYEYDADRALTRIIRPDGGILDLGYDTAGRLSGLSLPAGQGQVNYGYDPVTGRLITIAAPDAGTLTYTFNGALLTGSSWAGTVSGFVGRTYDNDFRLASLNVNGANPVAYAYDADSLLTGAGAMVLGRRADNGLLSGTTLGVVADGRTHNGFGEVEAYVAQANAADVFAVQYTRDTLGRIVTRTETVEGVTHAHDYGYDTAGRLAEVKKDGAVIAGYTYDSNGNRLSAPGLSTAPTYDAQDRLLTYGGATYVYTANGELSSKTVGPQVTTYEYDALGSLRHAGLPDGRQVDYVLDGTGRRIGKKIDGTLVQGFLYQDGLKPIAELNGTGTIVSRFVYATRVNVPDYMVKGGVTFRILTDHLGSPRLVVNTANGSIAQRMDYDEWGNVTLDDNPGFQPFGFAGGLCDLDTKLVRFGARDYDAGTGRWTAKDPVLFSGRDANLSAYAGNDPVNMTDPAGKTPLHLLLGGLAAGVAVTLAADIYLGKPFGETLFDVFLELVPQDDAFGIGVNEDYARDIYTGDHSAFTDPASGGSSAANRRALEAAGHCD